MFFRDSCRREARRRQVRGWVTNAADGSVEAVFEGEAEAVEHMVAWARRGPARASVTGFEIVVEEPAGETGFAVR